MSLWNQNHVEPPASLIFIGVHFFVFLAWCYWEFLMWAFRHIHITIGS